MYIAVVLAQTLFLPLVSGTIHLAVAGGNVLVVFGMWWAFWGVGTRLLVAGVSQLANPTRTTQGILGLQDEKANLVVHELGFANLSFGAAATTLSLFPAWGRSRCGSWRHLPGAGRIPSHRGTGERT